MAGLKRLRRAPGFWVFLSSFALCVFVAGGHLYSPDEEVLFRTAESFARLRGGAISPLGGSQQAVTRQGQVVTVYEPGFASRRGLGGQEYAQYGIGQPLLAVPLVWLGDLYAHFAGETARRTLAVPVQYHEGTPQSYARRLAVSHFNLLVTAATAWLIYLLACRLCKDHRAAMATAGLYVAATIALPHSKTFFTEPLAALCVLGSIALALRADEQQALGSERPAKGVLALSGFLFGWGILTRLDTIAMGLGPALLVLWIARRRGPLLRRAALADLVRWGLPVAGCVLLILLLNQVRYGSLLASGYADQPEGVKFSTPLFTGLGGFLFSPGRSLFVFSPVLLLAPVGWWRLRREHRPLAWTIALSAAGFLLFQSKWQNWSGGWDWGPRHIFQLAPLLALLLAGFFDEGGTLKAAWKRVVLLALSIAGIGINVLGVGANPIEAYAALPVPLRALTIWTPSLSPWALHLNRIAEGGRDLLLPRLLAGPSAGMKAAAVAILAFLALSLWGWWRSWTAGPGSQPQQQA